MWCTGLSEGVHFLIRLSSCIEHDVTNVLTLSFPFSYEEVKLTNFTSSWNDGLAFCAIVNRHRPDLLDYDSCDPSKPLENLEKAFSTMQNALGVARIVDPEGDRKST